MDYSKYKNTITPERSLKTYEMWVIFFCMGLAAMSGQVLTSQIASIAKAQARVGNRWRKS